MPVSRTRSALPPSLPARSVSGDDLPPISNTHSTMKKALITGITGQDGAYLAEFLEQGL